MASIHPILKPIPISGQTNPEYGLWFVLSDIIGSENAGAETEKSSMSKFKEKVKDSVGNLNYGKDGEAPVVPIRMSEDEYKKYFVLDQPEGVPEPPGGMQAWLKQHLDEQKPKERKRRAIGGTDIIYGAAGGSGIDASMAF